MSIIEEHRDEAIDLLEADELLPDFVLRRLRLPKVSAGTVITVRTPQGTGFYEDQGEPVQ